MPAVAFCDVNTVTGQHNVRRDKVKVHAAKVRAAKVRDKCLADKVTSPLSPFLASQLAH